MGMRYTFYIFLLAAGFLYGCQCGVERPAPDQPLIKTSADFPRAYQWNTGISIPADPAEACVSCHASVVTEYRDSRKYKTSRPVDSKTAKRIVETTTTNTRYSVNQNGENALVIKETIPFEERSRSATASLAIGSRSQVFSGHINGEQRLLPLYFKHPENRLAGTQGYRHNVVIPFTSSTTTDCSGCHGLHDETPSVHGIPCSGCHGDVAEHSLGNGQTHTTQHKSALDTFEGQSRICGQCHTHAKARLAQHDLSMTPRPNTHAAQFNDLVIYARTAYRDERGSDHGKHLSESKCFQDRAPNIPKCSSCHDPHGGKGLTQRTRTTCQNCHQSYKPCLNAASRAPNADCGQCHISRLTKGERPHYNDLIHRIVRVPTTPAYWKSIQLRQLTQDFSPLRSRAESDAEKAVERALVSLEFTRNRDKPNQAKKLEDARKQWPNAEATLALMRYALKTQNLTDAQRHRKTYEIAQPLPDSARLLWAQTHQQMGQHSEALSMLSSMSETSVRVQMAQLHSHIQLGQIKPAVDLVMTLRTTEMNDSIFLLRLAQLERLRDQDGAAEHWLQTSISIEPHLAKTYVVLAEIYRDAQDLKRAIQVLSNGLTRNPSNAEIYNLRGAIHKSRDDLASATADWEASLRVNRKQFVIYAQLFKVALDTGDRNSARILIEQGKQYLPNDPRWVPLTDALKNRRRKK